MDIKEILLQWFINFLIKKLLVAVLKTKIYSNKELVKKLHKPIIRKFNKRKENPPLIDNICGADLADMELISKFNKGFRFLLCVIDIYCKYACVIPLKDKKKVLQLLMLFRNF